MTQIEYCVWTDDGRNTTILYPKNSWIADAKTGSLSAVTEDIRLIMVALGLDPGGHVRVADDNSPFVTLDDSLDPPPEKKVDRFDNILENS